MGKKNRRGGKHHRRSAKNKSTIITTTKLPNDIWLHVLSFLTKKRITQLTLINEFFHQYAHKVSIDPCISEIESKWNNMAQIMRDEPCSKKVANPYEHHCERGCFERTETELLCTIYENTTHHLAVQHDYCPRDCDVLSWWIQGEMNGYRFL